MYNNDPIISGNGWNVAEKFVNSYRPELIRQGFWNEINLINDADSDERLAVLAWEYILDNFYFEDELRNTRSYLEQTSTGLWAVPAECVL